MKLLKKSFTLVLLCAFIFSISIAASTVVSADTIDTTNGSVSVGSSSYWTKGVLLYYPGSITVRAETSTAATATLSTYVNATFTLYGMLTGEPQSAYGSSSAQVSYPATGFDFAFGSHQVWYGNDHWSGGTSSG